MFFCVFYSGISPTPFNTSLGLYGNFFISLWSVTPESTSTVSSPVSIPATMSVSIRSPIITASSECTPSMRSPVLIISGFGLPTKYAFCPVAISIGDIIARQAGIIPSSAGPVRSLLVPISLAPLITSFTALRIFS